MTRDYYEVLGVKPGASEAEIRAAYKQIPPGFLAALRVAARNIRAVARRQMPRAWSASSNSGGSSVVSDPSRMTRSGFLSDFAQLAPGVAGGLREHVQEVVRGHEARARAREEEAARLQYPAGLAVVGPEVRDPDGDVTAGVDDVVVAVVELVDEPVGRIDGDLPARQHDAEDVGFLEDAGLVDEVANLVEYPVAVPGTFSREFLRIPKEVLITAMREHQRYFSVVDNRGELLPCFITISNTRAEDMEVVAGDVLITPQPKSGFAVKAEGEYVVALDTAITPELPFLAPMRWSAPARMNSRIIWRWVGIRTAASVCGNAARSRDQA